MSSPGATSSGHRGPGAEDPNQPRAVATDQPPAYAATDATQQPYIPGETTQPPTPRQQPAEPPPGIDGLQLPQARLRGDPPQETQPTQQGTKRPSEQPPGGPEPS